MPRSWPELLGDADAAPEPEAERAGLFSRLRDSLSKSRRALTEQIQAAAFDPVGDLAGALVDEAAALLGDSGLLHVRERPSVVLVVGVNGTGKTTTIGKLAA